MAGMKFDVREEYGPAHETESEERSLDFARDDNDSFAWDDNGSFARDDNGSFARDDGDSFVRDDDDSFAPG